MELKVLRKIKTNTSTIGEFFVDNVRECFTLEDRDRGLKQGMSVVDIKAEKVYSKTAIPAGRYEVILNYSNRFKKYMPLLLNVPGFEGVRIHPGNYATDTEGCILLGKSQGVDFIGHSRDAYFGFMEKLKRAEGKEKIFITIE